MGGCTKHTGPLPPIERFFKVQEFLEQVFWNVDISLLQHVQDKVQSTQDAVLSDSRKKRSTSNSSLSLEPYNETKFASKFAHWGTDDGEVLVSLINVSDKMDSYGRTVYHFTLEFLRDLKHSPMANFGISATTKCFVGLFLKTEIHQAGQYETRKN